LFFVVAGGLGGYYTAVVSASMDMLSC